jgi:AcrR family transcriptional regulator
MTAVDARAVQGPPEVSVVSVASLRERKKRATRNALRRSAMRLVAERGLAAVTVDDIAADADVSARTFFNYFQSKEDAVTGWDPTVVADMVDHLRSRPASESVPEALRATLLKVFSRFDSDHRDLLEQLQAIRSDAHLVANQASRWADTERRLVAALAERRGTDAAHDHYASLVVATSLAAARVATMSWCDKEGRAVLAEEIAFHLDVLGAGLADPERSSQ